ncbi:MAG: secondary thiamine-phosphate synthase enzyme YjbQ [Pseudomonadota bacterium]
MTSTITVTAPRRGLHEITREVQTALSSQPAASGLLHLFLQHTSASLIIQENADSAVQRDLEDWLDRQVPDGDPRYRHDAEGPDDMPAHIKGAITATELMIPVHAGRLQLGTWQGLFLWEHRTQPRPRRLVLTLLPCSDGQAAVA